MKIATLGVITRVNRKTRKRQVLLGFKHYKAEVGEGTLNGPGGKREEGETIIECLIRETKAEMRIALDSTRLRKVAIITFHAAGIPTFRVHVFTTESFAGVPKETAEMKPAWYDVDELPVDRMLESDRVWFPRLIRGERFNANVYYREPPAQGFEKIEFSLFEDIW